MTLFNLFLLAIVQGVTEFLPISSSGHLILFPMLTGLRDQGQAIDVAVHVGTLGAVVLYFKDDVRRVLSGVPKLLRWQIDDHDSRLALCLAVATVPVILVGFVLHATGLDAAMRSVAVIGWTMLLFGILLWWADQKSPQTRDIQALTLRQAVALGLWQALALIPGTSRSGITITGARFLGYTREDAARISMLMSIPTILASGTLLALDVVGSADMALLRDGAIGAVFAFVAAYATLAVMMRLLKRISYTPYVVYRVLLGLVLLGIAYT